MVIYRKATACIQQRIAGCAYFGMLHGIEPVLGRIHRGKVLKYDLKQGSRGVSEETPRHIPVEAIRHGKMMMQLFLNSCGYREEEI